MSAYYGTSVFRYLSKIDPTREFRTHEDARAFDREAAVNVLGRYNGETLRRAYTNRDEALVAILRFLADEFDDAPQKNSTEAA